jgi:hypothetical protein
MFLVCYGTIRVLYKERKGNNQFVWGSGKDTLKTINKYILRDVDRPSLCWTVHAVGPA